MKLDNVPRKINTLLFVVNMYDLDKVGIPCFVLQHQEIAVPTSLFLACDFSLVYLL